MEPTAQQKIIDFLVVGGPVVWILLGFSVVALTIVLAKVIQFAGLKAESTKTADKAIDAWRKDNLDGAIKNLRPQRPIDGVVSFAIRALQNASMDLATVREETERLALKQLHTLRSFLRPLEIIASLSPLLGLLGTVLGMIAAFQKMEGAGSQVDPSVLSGGIWQALLTTAVGIAVAVPVMTLHAWLERKVERVAHNMNDAVTRVFTSRELNRVASLQKNEKEVKHAA
ncbi:MotA/TolQ/ExbB proton channel family protein [Marinomonas mediterranea]|jgi:outer membrane transport energization protein ExbB (TC 2.C.1.1.1)|uniref:MotA/TolQ/ExbB proton channel n=1 Tax=Marinomonas mediterranea (strain ATCC 700492 / JCM 21426 / NBRC 103028 / MMB-1) TaxID=717774 RepID=F2JZG6_MARM1|nr:MotA/TolQ/ExbB proton channel family protein [Marinomonas mediterranea]ADZ89749.1 MotA/TolQ/ExbB proton channel [Marinomonas mediterranea MMB-1]WCN11936.1 MotA/TolQ/ExbB proton channel family protein [Marinomonas mediterranea]WCN15974.1 MotA/TolQ/ExbB proton channel family protein [Marinomonas mediterranea MMB-1]